MSVEVASPPNARTEAIAALKALDAPPPAPAATPAPGEAAKPAIVTTEAVPESPDAEAAPPAPPDPDPEPVETTEVKAKPDDELKAKLRAKNAEISRREAEIRRQNEEINAHRTRLAEERKALDEQAEKFRRSTLDLGRMAREEPTKFLELTGIPLNDLVKARMAEGKPEAVAERALRELEELKSQFRAQREEAERASKAAREKAQNDALEAEFKSEVLKLGDTSFAAKMMKRNPSLAMENAYAVSRVLHRENGGAPPTMGQLAARLEKEIRQALEDEAAEAAQASPAPSAPAAKLSPKSAAKAAPPPKEIKDMTEKERRNAAINELLKLEKGA